MGGWTVGADVVVGQGYEADVVSGGLVGGGPGSGAAAEVEDDLGFRDCRVHRDSIAHFRGGGERMGDFSAWGRILAGFRL